MFGCSQARYAQQMVEDFTRGGIKTNDPSEAGDYTDASADPLEPTSDYADDVDIIA